DRVVLKERRVAGDAVHEFTSFVPLEEGQGLAMDVGVETASQIVRVLVEHPGFHLQERRMRHIQEHNHAQHPQAQDVETQTVDLPKSRVDSQPQQPWDSELSRGYCQGTTEQGEPESLAIRDIAPEE